MKLASLRVEGYSGIRSASLELEPDLTAIVGENDSGKRRLLEALHAVLGGAPDRGAPQLGPGVRVELDFVEGDGRHTLVASDGTWALDGDSDPELLTQLRRLNPVISLRRATWGRPDQRVRSAPADLRALVDQVVMSATELLDGTAADPELELERGFAAAKQVIERAEQYLDPQRSVVHPVVAEVMGGLPGGAGPALPEWTGTSAERIGVLFVVASLLKEIDRPFEPGAQPILVVESLEAYMHVMTLAAAMRLLERVRWQRIFTTESTDLLGEIPLGKVRRLVRHEDVVYESRIDPGSLSPTDLRRITYHLRARRGQAMFARCWLLVEGESEAWLMPELARLLGYDLAQEGIAIVEFAQAGLAPAIRTADGLGIEWHVLTDGDEAGRIYRDLALEHAGVEPPGNRVTALREPDLELFLWHHGYAEVYKRVAKVGKLSAAMAPRRIIRRAIDNASKPMLALEVLSTIAERGEAGVPSPLRGLIETCVMLAREAPARQAARRLAGQGDAA
jgi:putative ATP-dependent endonuclease of the OLD family